MSDQQLQDEQAMVDMDYSEPTLPPPAAWKNIIRPVTISQILRAEPSPFFEDKALVIEGRGFTHVTLVAHVRSKEDRSGSISYCLDDGTGNITARKVLDSLHYLRGQCPEAEKKERAQLLALEDTYVEVIGTPSKSSNLRSPFQKFLSIISISPVHDYHQVMYHILNVIHCNILIQQHVQPYTSNMDPESNEHLAEDLGDEMVVEDTLVIPSHPILPNAFSPQRQQPYATLEPLQRAIVTQMYHKGDTHVLIAELAEVMQASYRCTQFQFNLAIQALLAEAYLTSPLDNGNRTASDLFISA